MNQPLKKKILNIGACVLYLGTVISIVVASSSLMKSSFYNYVFVSGSSMEPTLYGGGSNEARGPYIDSQGYHKGSRVHFGLTDNSSKAKKNIKRYDILTVYYPYSFVSASDYNSEGKLLKTADYKIKRVIALPGETFKIEQGELYIMQDNEFVKQERSYQIEDGGNKSVKDVTVQTLKDNEYWVMGDHRNGSTDCASKYGDRYNGPITYVNITGVLVCIEGYAEYYNKYYCDKCGHRMDEQTMLENPNAHCDKCGYPGISKKGDIRNKEYTYPRII